ncbi:MAG TPA: hypothetical protein VME92_04815 [Acetobacteraceae bacterium]|nr:hypothetical protein [Acetobacteraceae bacterium]
MDRPLEITFRNAPSSEPLQAEIRRQAAALYEDYPELAGCRVAVEAVHERQRGTSTYLVQIDLALAGRSLAVTGDAAPDAQSDMRTAIATAFDAAARALAAPPVPAGRPAPTLSGEVILLDDAAGHGVLLAADGSQLGFGRDAVIDGRFEDLAIGTVVTYAEATGGSGPEAVTVRAVQPDEDFE